MVEEARGSLTMSEMETVIAIVVFWIVAGICAWVFLDRDQW